MSTDPTTTTRASAPSVVAVVSADDAALLAGCLDAIGRQVYGPSKVFVVGGDEAVRRVAGEKDASWRANLRGIYDSMGGGIDYVWALRQRARPEPGALQALVEDGARVDASVAGSKVVDSANPELLVSVGYATDVFDAPYTGLQAGELDQAQFDVIRDVASVADTSMLIRRDLFRGLGGVDRLMEPSSAAVDFCQRARLRGGRVVVVPSSVVRYEGQDPTPRWRERAGETRAMIKAYSPLTLAWSLPVAFLVGVVESIFGPFVGRFPLPGLLAAGFWNLYHLPSALRDRRNARQGHEVGDEELFRYQVNGSARLRSLYEELLERIRLRFPEGVLSGFSEAVEAGQQRVRNPAFFVGFLAVAFALIATRQIWGQHLPVVGYSLPPAASPTTALSAYAGGWNPGGLGSPEVVHPSVAATALVQILTFARAWAAVAVIVVASFIAGVFGMVRLLRAWGIGSVPGYLAGIVLMGGPAFGAAAAGTRWGVIPAIATLPWAIAATVRPWSGGLSSRIAATAGAVIAIGITAVYFPTALVIPLLAAVTWAVVGVGSRIPVLGRALVATLLAIPLLLPWVLYTDLGRLVTDGESAFWSPAWVVVLAAAMAVAAILWSGEEVLAAVAGWGAVLAAVGGLISRLGGFGAGAQIEAAGEITVALGMAIVAGAAFELTRRRRVLSASAARLALVGTLGASVLLVSTLLLAGPGRAGLPGDEMTGDFDFATASDGPATRVLLFGMGVPGEARNLEGLPYRVIVPPYPTTLEAPLNDPRLGDDALDAMLQDLLDGRVRRAGDALATFGIGWVAFTETSPLQALFDAQLDLVPLRSLDFPVYRNEVPAAIARDYDGRDWVSSGTGYRSADRRQSNSVVLAVNADYRWGPGAWQQDDWRNLVTAPGDGVRFKPYGPRRVMATVSGAWMLLLFGAWTLGRVRKTPR
ncbi:MAG: hypothetical protein A2Z12_03720 [Actinobacteria bacterium RBG_16_68_21]|nr:MAG: hypothetical protein A2Z12_03720 [Actinobacteria bacterium RBG_16_68_21]